ncbi:gamma-glutamyltransferase [Synechococcus sp. PCC 7335]|uniref:gamma-glutamyltransferase n=1 Tax=Synechococcus sp. (strain ATCC 29403 / PCC 7335) TaxID=91464 RepID=UPI00017EB88E|nr:gamma-glutamyltransferase [Synechococcus sp. PCC 7335]EDX86959.1 gamma-glutamyltransferase [Synechococcus sp. PCC 7335]
MRRRLLLSALALCVGVLLSLARFSSAQSQARPVAQGTGGAVASVDAAATQVGIDVLRSGGNAVDAAVATAAALGVTEPFSAGVGGGGFMLVYQPDTQSVVSLDGREEAPASATPDLFRDPDSALGEPLPFFPNRISSGLSVGVPGTPLNWATAVERYGTMSLAELLQPAIALAEKGFTVDETFAEQIAANQERFSAFETTRSLYLPDDKPPAVGSQFVNPELAKTYRLLAEQGANAFYRGEIGEAIAQTVQNPPVVSDPPFSVWPGRLTTNDLDRYEVRVRPAIETDYRDYTIYGMGLPSSGGITVAQTLNLLSDYDLLTLDRAEALSRVIEAERLAFADRNAYIGDPEYVDVPVDGLLSIDYAEERRQELPLTVPADESSYQAPVGNPLPYQQDPSPSLEAPPVLVETKATEGISTTHLTVVDRDGMVVSYTLTIESTGGSGMVVPGYGFILNNELTDFDLENPHPNVPESGKRPRSSMSPTILFSSEGEIIAFGSPGGSTIITTAVGITVNLVDFRMSLAEAIAAPRLSQRNQGITLVDQNFAETETGQALVESGYQLDATEEIGAATGIVLLPDGTILAAAEPTRRGGGSAQVLDQMPE